MPHPRINLYAMNGDIERVLISQAQIAERVRELAEQITSDHIGQAQSGELTIIPILAGAMIFAADLIRHLPMRMKIGLLTVSSYPGQSLVSQGAKIVSQQLGDLNGQRVLLVDDVLDSGNTMRLVQPLLMQMSVASLRSCVLLRKRRPEADNILIDYTGFDIPDEFVVGYGLDYNNYYRNLPEIVTLKRNALAHPGSH